MTLFFAKPRRGAAFSISAAVFAVVLVAAGAAHADVSSAEYLGCDGYGAASSEGDGMTERASFLFVFNPPGYGNTDVFETAPEGTGVVDCDAALSDLPEQHWMRKVSLLRARAVHHLESLDAISALADLDLAAAAVKDSADPYYARSLGIGTDLVRALALRISGDQARAEAIAVQAVTTRPYNRQVLLSALIAIGPGAAPQSMETVRHAIGRLIPAEIADQFLDAYDSGDFATAIALYPQLSPSEEIGNINVSSAELAERKWRDFETARKFWSWSDGAYAYALAATGKPAEARAAIDAARARLAKDTVPPAPLSAQDAKDNEAAALYRGEIDIRQRAAVEGKQVIDVWAGMVELRITIAEGKIKEAMTAFRGQTLVHSWASVDLFNAMVAALPEKQRPAVSPAQSLKVKLAQEQLDRLKSKARDLFNSLPQPETSHRIPPYEEAVKPFLAMSGSQADIDTEGYRIAGPDDQGVVTVSFRGVQAGDATVEEMALLAAADAARKAGKKGLVVLKRQDVRYTVSTTNYGVTVRTDPQGYQTELHVLFVDPAGLPPQYAGAPWRVIDADAVYESLAPFYTKPSKKH